MCRFVIIQDVDGQMYEYMEQNPHTLSIYAKSAREGKKLTWRIPHSVTGDNNPGPRLTSKWKLITDNDEPIPEEVQKIPIIL